MVCPMATLLLAGLDVRHGWAAGVHGDQPSANSLDFHPPQKFHATRSVPLSGVNDSLDRLRRLQARLLSQVSPSAGSLQSQAVALSELSSILLSQGQTQVALDAATQAQQIFRSFLKDQPDSTTHQRYLAVSLVTVGDAQGNLPEVLKSYQRSLAILDRLAKSDPGNAVWQRDLASGYARLGACFEQVADLADARNAFSEGRLIIIHLLTRFPDHPQWTRDLANFDSAILALGEPVPQSRSRN
jgi:tetratricopeptide (TPR) repeat protein